MPALHREGCRRGWAFFGGGGGSSLPFRMDVLGASLRPWFSLLTVNQLSGLRRMSRRVIGAAVKRTSVGHRALASPLCFGNRPAGTHVGADPRHCDEMKIYGFERSFRCLGIRGL